MENIKIDLSDVEKAVELIEKLKSNIKEINNSNNSFEITKKVVRDWANHDHDKRIIPELPYIPLTLRDTLINKFNKAESSLQNIEGNNSGLCLRIQKELVNIRLILGVMS